jgi:hypothetical protein
MSIRASGDVRSKYIRFGTYDQRRRSYISMLPVAAFICIYGVYVFLLQLGFF